MESLDDVCIVLIGYAVNSEQIEQLINNYKTLGITKFVVSSYDYLISNYIKDTYPVVINDDPLWGDIKTVNFYTKNQHKGIKNKNIFIYSNEPVKTKFGSHNYNLNFQILTTKRGIELAKSYYPECKFVLKNRADIRLDNLDFTTYKKIIQERTRDNLLTESIMIVNGGMKTEQFSKGNMIHIPSNPWYLCDSWIFGFMSDIYKQSNIPLNNKNYICAEQYIAQTYLKSNMEKIDIDDYFVGDSKILRYSYKFNKYVNWKTE